MLPYTLCQYHVAPIGFANSLGTFRLQVPLDQPLMEAGLDSLGIGELRSSVQQTFAVELPATAAFDYPTSAALAAFIHPLLASPHSQSGMGTHPALHPPTTADTLLRVDRPLGSITAQLQAIVSGLLGNEVPEDQPLMQAGLDSLGAAELRNGIQAQFDIQVGATVVFDHPTIAALTRMVGALLMPQDQPSGAVTAHAVGRHALDLSPSVGPGSGQVGLWGLACRYPSHSSGETGVGNLNNVKCPGQTRLQSFLHTVWRQRLSRIADYAMTSRVGFTLSFSTVMPSEARIDKYQGQKATGIVSMELWTSLR